MSVDGTFATGTAALEKRALADEIPIWDASICIDCGKCAIVCPHAAIRMKVVRRRDAQRRPRRASSPRRTAVTSCREGTLLTVQVAPDDCTGCGICVAVCPVRDKLDPEHKAIDLAPAAEHRDVERPHFEYFLEIPEVDRTLVRADTVKGSQLLQPLFEFSGACAGCGETPYLKLVTQLLGDRMVVANATGCSSIYGGNLPTTPWAKDSDGRGPAWVNSLFEDNAEFGLGIRLGVERQTSDAHRLLRALADDLPADVVGAARRADPPAVDRRAGHRRSAARTSRGCATALARRSTTRGRRRWPRSPTRSCRPRSGSWAATAGPTTSTSAGSTTCSPRAQRQHPRARHRGVLQHRRPGVEVDAARCRRRSSPARARAPRRRTSGCSRRPTATSTSRRSRWAPTRPRPCARSSRLPRGRARR